MHEQSFFSKKSPLKLKKILLCEKMFKVSNVKVFQAAQGCKLSRCTFLLTVKAMGSVIGVHDLC